MGHSNFLLPLLLLPLLLPLAQGRGGEEEADPAYYEPAGGGGGYYAESYPYAEQEQEDWESGGGKVGEGEGPPPETRDGGGFLPGGFVGPAPFDPLPPPPQAIKGSVDYILIPLVLIGIAGPIFVVLYVILGAFEAKLSPITRRSLEAYQPYLERLLGSLDGPECLSWMGCEGN